MLIILIISNFMNFDQKVYSIKIRIKTETDLSQSLSNEYIRKYIPLK